MTDPTLYERKILQSLANLTALVLELRSDQKVLRALVKTTRESIVKWGTAKAEVRSLRRTVADLRAEQRARGRLSASLERLAGDEPDRFEYIKNKKGNHSTK